MPYKFRDWFSTYPRGNYWNDREAIENNANLVAVDLRRQGYCDESIYAILGNMEFESGLNPYAFEGGLSPEFFPEEEGGPYSPGYWTRGWGLVQWTPGADCWNWIKDNRMDVRDGYSQMKRLQYEYENGLEWYYTEQWSKYPISWEQFKTNETQLTIEQLTECFMLNYLRPGSYATLPFRQAYALSWVDFPGLFLDRWQTRFMEFFKKHRIGKRGLY